MHLESQYQLLDAVARLQMDPRKRQSKVLVEILVDCLGEGPMPISLQDSFIHPRSEEISWGTGIWKMRRVKVNFKVV